MRLKLFRGLFGADLSALYTPNGKRIPMPIGAPKIQSFLNRFAWIGMKGTRKAIWIK